MNNPKTKNFLVATNLTLLMLGMAAIPYIVLNTTPRLSDSDKNLAGQAAIRGAYLNTGSKDAGPDPDWDPKTRTWQGKRF